MGIKMGVDRNPLPPKRIVLKTGSIHIPMTLSRCKNCCRVFRCRECHWIVAVTPAGDDGKAVDPYL